MEKGFKEKLGKLLRFVTRWGITKYSTRLKKSVQKGVDILLAIDLTEISVSRAVDRVVLVVNDTDFIPAIKKARDNFTLVTLAFFPESNISTRLVRECDEYLTIESKIIDASLAKKV
jgi:uncharacterized LabA/DUF88 family protein